MRFPFRVNCVTNVGDGRRRETQISKLGNTNTATKTATKTNRKVKAAAKPTTTKAIKQNSPVAKESKPANKKMSQIEAAVTVLAKSKEPMNCRSMVEAMQVQGLWSTPGGATPEATHYASILREINGMGKDARFKKVDRGLFALAKRN